MTNIFIALLMDLKVRDKTKQASKDYNANAITPKQLFTVSIHTAKLTFSQETALFYSLMAKAFHIPVHTILLSHFPPTHCRLCHAFTISCNPFSKMFHLRKVKVMVYAYPVGAKINLTICLQFNSTTVMS